MHFVKRNVLVAALAFSASCASGTAPMDADCDRACLTATLNGYLEALTSGDLSSARLAPDFRATRNGAEISDRTALAESFARLGDVQRFYADPVNGQAAYLGLVEEESGVALTAIRIRVERGEISESEQFIARPGDVLFSADGFRAQPPRDARSASLNEPQTREAMVTAADAYFEALTVHDSTIIPHVEGCDRLENGTRVTNRAPRGTPADEVEATEFQARDCAAGMEGMTQIREVAYRRYPLIDEEAGVVMGVGLFLRPPGQSGNFARRNLLTEFFEVDGGRIAGIYAVMHYLDADAPESTGWR